MRLATPTKFCSVRLSMAALQELRKYQQANPSLTMARHIVQGLTILQDRYPDRLLQSEMERLLRRANAYDRLTDGSRTYTKVRIPTTQYEWLKFNEISITAACEFAIMDAQKYRHRIVF